MPLIYRIRCDGPACPREDVAQFDPQRGYYAPDWINFGGRTYCSYQCFAPYVLAEAQAEVDRLTEALAEQAERARQAEAPPELPEEVPVG